MLRMWKSFKVRLNEDTGKNLKTSAIISGLSEADFSTGGNEQTESN